MELQNYTREQVNQYLGQIEDESMKRYLYVCFRLQICQKYIDQLAKEASIDKRELLKTAIMDDYPEAVYNQMVSADLEECRKIREEYLIKKYTEKNPVFQEAEKQVEEFNKLRETYQENLKQNEMLVDAIKSANGVAEKQIALLEKSSAEVKQEKDKMIAEKEKIIGELKAEREQLKEKLEAERERSEQLQKEAENAKTEIIRANGEKEKEIAILKKEKACLEEKMQNQPASIQKANENRSENQGQGVTNQEKKDFIQYLKETGLNSQQLDFISMCLKRGYSIENLKTVADAKFTEKQMQDLLEWIDPEKETRRKRRWIF